MKASEISSVQGENSTDFQSIPNLHSMAYIHRKKSSGNNVYSQAGITGLKGSGISLHSPEGKKFVNSNIIIPDISKINSTHELNKTSTQGKIQTIAVNEGNQDAEDSAQTPKVNETMTPVLQRGNSDSVTRSERKKKRSQLGKTVMNDVKLPNL